MITIPGQTIRTCEGMTRRDWLRLGTVGSLGVSSLSRSVAGADRSAVRSSTTGTPRAKACIVLFMFGAPAHQDTWDLKPEAPSSVRGEFQPIATNVAGTFVSEHIPQLAQLANRYVQIRSLTHLDNTHTVAMHAMLSGVRHRRPATNPQNAPDDFPCFGAVVNHLDRRRSKTLPAAVSLNAPANQVSANNHIFPGFFAGFLGSEFDPLFVSQHANRPDFQPLPTIDNARRLLDRRHLLTEFDRQSAAIQERAGIRQFDSHYEQAMQLLTSSAVRRAFEVSEEPAALRERYGQTPFGQGCLLARRLVEAGVSLVTVNWEQDDAYWDTHADNFNKHKKLLLPNMDRGFSALLLDLEERGLLDETLIVWLGEFGRTPTINASAGRDHWAACNTVVLAGAGLRGGQIFGASDRHAAYPTRDPVGPEDLAATIYHLLGIDQQHILRTPEGQPLPISTGNPIHAIL